MVGKWIWVNLGPIALVWLAEVWTITATEVEYSIVIASPHKHDGGDAL